MALIDNILFSYSCNDDEGNTTVIDGTTTQDGTLAGGNNTQDISNPAKLGDGFNLDGSADYINANQNLNANTTTLSFQMWFNLDDLDSNSALFSTDIDNTGTRGFQCQILTDGTIRIFDGTTSHASATGLISATTDHHLIFVLNGSSSKVYLDGVLRLNASASYGNTSKALLIGQRSVTNASNFIDGIIDEADGWTKALTDGGVSLNATAGGEVAELYNSGSGLAYPFIDLIAQSTSFESNNGTFVSATLTPTFTGNTPTFRMRADKTKSFEDVSEGVRHFFANSGSEVQWQAEGSGTVITNLKIEVFP